MSGDARHFNIETLAVTKRVLFLHDNAPAHLALATQKKITYLGFGIFSARSK
jgi:hypothetical protein